MASPEELKAEILRRQAKAKQAAGAALNTPSAASGAAPAVQMSESGLYPVGVPENQMSQEELIQKSWAESDAPDWMKSTVSGLGKVTNFFEPLAHGARFGLDEEIAGLGAGVKNTLQNLFGDEPTGKTFGEAFTEREEAEEAGYERLKQQHVAPGTAEFVGSFASGGPAGGQAINAARLGLRQMFTQGAKSGAVAGALTGLGESEGGIGDRLKAMLIGGGTGAGIGGTLSTALPAVPALIRRLFGGATDDALTRTASNVAAMEGSGMTPTLMAASTSKPAGWVAKASATAPLVGDVAETSARRTIQEGGEAVEQLASTYGTAQGAREAGEAAQAGIQRFTGTKPLPGTMTVPEAERIMLAPTAANSFKQKETALYRLAENQIPQRAQYRPRETVMMLGQLTDRFPSNPALSQSQAQGPLRQMIEDLTGPQAVNGLTFRELQSLRTRVGEGLADPKVFPEVGQQELRALYGALSRDLDNMVAAFDANGRATQLWNRANKYAAAGRSQFEKLQKLTGGKTDEDVVRALWQASQSGVGKGNLALLNAARRSMGDEAWNDVSAGLLREMGLETKGAALNAERGFSPATFMTNYAGMSREAKDRVFGTGAQRNALERLAQVFGQEKATGRLANVSNSANQAQSIAWLLTLPVSAPAWAGAGVWTKAMTSPAFARWVARATQAQTPAQQRAALQGLAVVGRQLGWSAAQLEAMAGAFQGRQQQPQN